MKIDNHIIRYNEKVDGTKILGPYDRAVIWVNGCPFACPGCIAPGYRGDEYKEISAEELAKWVIDTGKKELTISGGEPMLQAGPLYEMINIIKSKSDTGVIVYSGFTYERLMEIAECKTYEMPSADNKKTYIMKGEDIKAFLGNIDLLIDGPYIEEKDDNQPYRGSSNQRLIQLTDRYKDVITEYYMNTKGRKMEIKAYSDRTLMIGVPSKDQAKVWNNIKEMGKKND